MKITVEEAQQLGVLSDLIEIKGYGYYEFLENAQDLDEIEINIDEFKILMKIY